MSEAFATFLLLSSMKFLSVSFDLLKPTRVYDVTGSIISLHLPVLPVLPVFILLVFPSKCFQKLCRYQSIYGFQVLRTFADAFQGCFKNGTNGTKRLSMS